jgi:hypothetical protein
VKVLAHITANTKSSSLVLIARLAALVPPPKRHVVRYLGVLSSHPAELLRRVFGIEILCTKCKAPLRLIALIKSEATAKKILDAMHLPSELGPAHPTPAPRGFAAPVAKLHPARPPPTSCQEACGAEGWVN